jgi:hypothetical protein
VLTAMCSAQLERVKSRVPSLELKSGVCVVLHGEDLVDGPLGQLAGVAESGEG